MCVLWSSNSGLTKKPHCALCERGTAPLTPPSPVPPDPMPPTHRRPRTVDTSMHFCPHTGCRYRGWLGLGNLRANGHPSGGPWRQFQCTACEGYFPEHHGTIFHGKQVAVELIVRVLACLAEGLGIRATARVFEVAPNTVLHWLVEAAEQLQAFTSYFLCEVHVQQVQLDELYAVLSAVRDGADARRGGHPASVTLAALGLDGDRPAEQAAAGDRGRPAHAGDGPAHRPSGRAGTRAWLRPAVSDGRVEGIYDRVAEPFRLLGAACALPGHRPGAQAALDAAARAALCAGHQNDAAPAPGTRQSPGGLRDDARPCNRCWPPVAGRSTRPSWNASTSPSVSMWRRSVDASPPYARAKRVWRQQLALYHGYYNFCLPHGSLRQPLPQPVPTNGTGSAKHGGRVRPRWRPG